MTPERLGAVEVLQRHRGRYRDLRLVGKPQLAEILGATCITVPDIDQTPGQQTLVSERIGLSATATISAVAFSCPSAWTARRSTAPW